MEFPLTHLPDEVLSTVFSFLSVEDRLKACLVCKHWCQLINCKLLLSDINVCIKDYQCVNCFMSVTRKFLNYSFHNVDIFNNVCTLLKILNYVECISFSECIFNKNDTVVIEGTVFKNLKELRIFSSIVPVNLWCLFPSLPNLMKLEVHGRGLIYDNELSVLQKTVKHLKTLIIHTDLVSERKVYCRFYPKGLTYENSPSQYIFSFLALKSFISENIDSLSELNINCITTAALKELSTIKGLNLKKIKLSVTGNFLDSFKCLFLTQNNIKIFGLTSMHLDENETELMSLNLLNVQNLNVTDCDLSTKSLKNLFKLPKLQWLKISARSYVADRHETLNDIKSLTIRYFYLYNIQRLDKILFSQLKNLTLLTLKLCQVTDSDLRVIFECLLKLQFLDVSYNKDISDHGLTTSLITKETKDSSPVKAINNLKSLKFLDLSMCSVTATGLIATIKFCSLQYLLVYGYQLAEEIVSALQSQNPNLMSLIYNDRYFIEGKEITLKIINNYFL